MSEENIKEHGKVLATWNFPEYEQPERARTWYICASIVVAALLFYALLTVNFLFAVIVIMCAIILILRERFEPVSVDVSFTEKGVVLDDKFYPYAIFHSFFIIYKPGGVKNLYLEFKSVIKPRLIVPLISQDPVKIKQLLLQHLEEDLERDDEPISEILRKILKL